MGAISPQRILLFKQKTAYEIGVRLVGSEMCIRDSIKGDMVLLLFCVFSSRTIRNIGPTSKHGHVALGFHELLH